MRILILGGTAFLGVHCVQAALARGHDVTIFTRGRTSAERFAGDPRVEHLIGDRDPDVGSGLAAIAASLESGRRLDAVIDLSGYLPRHVAASAALLADHCERYLFVSSISVYAAPVPLGVDEEGPVIELEDPTTEDIGPNYGGLKWLAEEALREAVGERALVVRPGLIVGPLDFTDRFSFWPHAAANAERLVCPGDPDTPTQVIDGRDLALWMVKLVEQRAAGTFNASGPRDPYTIGELIADCLAGVGSEAQPVWLPADFLAQHEVQPWLQLPCWLPPGNEQAGMLSVDVRRAFDAGLVTRPLVETAADTLAWLAEELVERAKRDPEQAGLRAGIDAAKQAELLAAWDAHRAQA